MEQEKPSIFSRVMKLFKLAILVTIPSIKIMSFNKLLKRCSIITKDKWFKKQIHRNYVLATLMLIPILIGYLKASSIYNKDVAFQERIEKVQQMDSFLDRMPAYVSTIKLDNSDSAELVSKKVETQIRLTAIVIVFMMILGIQVSLAVLISYFHPIVTKTEKLTKLLIANGIVRKEDVNSSIIFATPVGFLITITGSSARDIAHMDRIWAGLNIRIKDWVEDDEERSLVFFRKAFELQSSYMYNDFPK